MSVVEAGRRYLHTNRRRDSEAGWFGTQEDPTFSWLSAHVSSPRAQLALSISNVVMMSLCAVIKVLMSLLS